jgi:hypothetical protein
MFAFQAIDQLMVANLMRILTLALGARLPSIFSTRDFVRGGGFLSYGPSYTERFQRAAIPVEQPTKFELVINFCAGGPRSRPNASARRPSELHKRSAPAIAVSRGERAAPGYQPYGL